jgi:hypothetical protein
MAVGLFGNTIVQMLDALSRSRIRYITERHKQLAAHAADRIRQGFRHARSRVAAYWSRTGELRDGHRECRIGLCAARSLQSYYSTVTHIRRSTCRWMPTSSKSGARSASASTVSAALRICRGSSSAHSQTGRARSGSRRCSNGFLFRRVARGFVQPQARTHGSHCLSNDRSGVECFGSTRQLEQTIRDSIESYNIEPKPFVWSKSADEILESVRRFCKRTLETGHERSVPEIDLIVA